MRLLCLERSICHQLFRLFQLMLQSVVSLNLLSLSRNVVRPLIISLVVDEPFHVPFGLVLVPDLVLECRVVSYLFLSNFEHHLLNLRVPLNTLFERRMLEGVKLRVLLADSCVGPKAVFLEKAVAISEIGAVCIRGKRYVEGLDIF